MTAPLSDRLKQLEEAHAAWRDGSPGWPDQALEAMESLPDLIAAVRAGLADEANGHLPLPLCDWTSEELAHLARFEATPAAPESFDPVAALRRVEVRPADSDEPATAAERSALTIDALWTEDDYPEYSQADVLHAYRLGYEDGSR